MKLTQDELMSVFKSEHFLRVYATDHKECTGGFKINQIRSILYGIKFSLYFNLIKNLNS